MMTEREIRIIANEILQATLGTHGFDRADVADDLDADGIEAVRVTAHFKPGSQPADGRAALAALAGLHAKLLAKGETRIPYLRYDYPDDDDPSAQPEEFDP